MVVLDRGFYLLKRDLFTTTDQRLRRHPTEPARAQPEKVLQQHRESLAMAQCFAVDRKSTRLNSSHSQISYAVFCLKKKKNPADRPRLTGLDFATASSKRWRLSC